MPMLAYRLRNRNRNLFWIVVLAGLTFGGLTIAPAGASSASSQVSASNSAASEVTTSSLGTYAPTYVGSASYVLLGPTVTGPLTDPGTSSGAAGTPQVTVNGIAPYQEGRVSGFRAPLTSGDPPSPVVSCVPPSIGCDSISSSAAGAVGVNGLNASSSGELSTNVLGIDIEPADQSLCAGNGYVIEDNNLGEIMIFTSNLAHHSDPISLDTLMGLTAIGWSSGGDISCVYDSANGGHWIFTEFVSASSEAVGGTFAGCFAAVAFGCYEGIAVSKTNNPWGLYYTYFFNTNYNPSEPGYPYLLNDFAKIAVTQDAFLLFYDEFPLLGGGFGGGYFNGAQELAFSKNALEFGLSPSNPLFNVAIMNMGYVPTPDGTCASDNTYGLPGISCWYQVIPAQAPDPSQYDNSHGGSAFMLGSLDFYGQSDTRIAIFDWTGLSGLNSWGCSRCGLIQFGGELFSGVELYYGEGFLGAQKAGPIPLGDECLLAGLIPSSSTFSSCPEGGIATNGDGFTQVSQGEGQVWGAVSTQIEQTYGPWARPELHQGAAYWVIGTSSWDFGGSFTLTNQGYVTAEHEDMEFPAIAAADHPSEGALMTFTLSGNETYGRFYGGFYPSTAYVLWSGSLSNGFFGTTIHIADLGRGAQDGFTEYEGDTSPTVSTASRPRWGDYSWAFFNPSTGRFYFATNFIQSPNCLPPAFTLTLGTCGGTRDGFANWGTSVNYVV